MPSPYPIQIVVHKLKTNDKITDPKGFLQANFTEVQAIVRNYCFNKGISKENQIKLDLESELFLFLTNDDYKKLRLFQGNSNRGTYLRTVACNCLTDIIRKIEKTRWRLPERIKYMGAIAVIFYESLFKSHMPVDEAKRRIMTDPAIDPKPTDEQLEVYLAEFQKHKKGKREISIEFSEDIEKTGVRKDPADNLFNSITRSNKENIIHLITKYTEKLNEEEKFIIRKRYHDNISISQIAKTLNQKRDVIDKKHKSILEAFAEYLALKGIEKEQALNIFDQEEPFDENKLISTILVLFIMMG
jgi:DNA-directed RNA polymerase specialized sigma24 family protein